jgi:hypothetical protein
VAVDGVSNVSALKLSNVSFRGKCARLGNALKLPSPTKLARLAHFPPASQAGRLVGPVFYVYVLSLVVPLKKVLVTSPSLPVCVKFYKNANFLLFTGTGIQNSKPQNTKITLILQKPAVSVQAILL